MLTENNPNLRMVLEKNPNFHEERYPADGMPGDEEKGLLEDAGKKLPLIDKVIFTREKENIPRWNKFRKDIMMQQALVRIVLTKPYN